MLARNAEALYWIGRYVERADDTARILDVTVHQLLEDSSVDADSTCRQLLQVLGIEAPEDELDMWSLTNLVAFSRDLKSGCSIVDAISAGPLCPWCWSMPANSTGWQRTSTCSANSSSRALCR